MTLTEMLDLLQPIFDRWHLVLLAIVLVTLLGNPARSLIGAIAVMLRAPAQFTRTDIEPALRRVAPSAQPRRSRIRSAPTSTAASPWRPTSSR